MKYSILNGFDVCNAKGDEMTVDLLLLQTDDGKQSKTMLFEPGTLTEIDDDFKTAEEQAWLEASEPLLRDTLPV